MPTTRSTLTCRPMLFSDIPAVVDVNSTAFIDDEFFSTRNPYRHERPLAWRYWCSSKLRNRLVQKDTWAFVCYRTSSSGQEEILGYTLWTYGTDGPGCTSTNLDGSPKRIVASPAVPTTNTSLFYMVERLRVSMEHYYNEHPLSPYHIPCGNKTPLSTLFGSAPVMTFNPPSVNDSSQKPAGKDREVDVEESKPQPTIQYSARGGAPIGLTGDLSPAAAAHPAFSTSTPFAPLPPLFYCTGLGVHPKAQRQGVGRTLMEHALQQLPTAHNVPAALISSPQGIGLYRSLGFKIMGWLSPPGLFEGGAAMVWNGNGEQYIHDVTKEDEDAEGDKVKVWGREVDAVYIYNDPHPAATLHVTR